MQIIIHATDLLILQRSPRLPLLFLSFCSFVMLTLTFLGVCTLLAELTNTPSTLPGIPPTTALSAFVGLLLAGLWASRLTTTKVIVDRRKQQLTLVHHSLLSYRQQEISIERITAVQSREKSGLIGTRTELALQLETEERLLLARRLRLSPLDDTPLLQLLRGYLGLTARPQHHQLEDTQRLGTACSAL